MEYTRLAQPLRVGSMTLKNRIMMVAMHHVYMDEDGLPTPRFCEYYWRRAEGGAGLITIGACRFDGYGARPSTMRLLSDEDAARYVPFVQGMHDRGAKVALQLYHAGRYMRHSEVPCGDEAIAPSAVYTGFTRETARAMTRAEIQQVIADWAAAARRAKAIGFDAVEISGSAGYLISQFLSPLANVREDEYGGSFENRCRFPLEVIAAVRQAVGEDYPLLLRLGGNDLVPGSNGSAECLAFAKVAAQSGIDMISLTGGWHESKVPQLTGELPEGGLAYLARDIRAAVEIPVAMANRLGDPALAEKALALGWCDAVAMGRPLLAEPDLPNKLFSGREALVRPCLSCNQGCLAGTFFDKPVRCLANGMAGREYCLSLAPAETPRAVLVVGGGPAGMETAMRLAQRGHKVTLWEAADELGGQLRLTAGLPARRGFGKLVEHYRRMLAEYGVAVELGRRADAEDVLAGGFEACVLATGMPYKAPQVKVTADAVPVYTHSDFLRTRPVLGRRVAVIGGSFVGLETARLLTMDAGLSPDNLFYLMRYGVEPDEKLHAMLRHTDRHVAVFERGKLGAGYESGIAWPVLGDLNYFGAELFKNTEVLEVNGEGVVTADFTWPCDAVVVVTGMQRDDSLLAALEGKLPVWQVGNARRIGRAIDAIQAGTELACSL